MSNETPKPSPAKTKSAPKRWIILLAALTAVLVTILLLAGRASAPAPARMTVNQGSADAATFSLETVTSDADQQRGLSGRNRLAPGRGMLFDYPGDREKRCIWMKDMKFNIDVIWLSRDKRIVSAIANLTPATYPQTYCAEAAYIVELPAGTIWEHGLRTGQVVGL